MYLAVSGQTLCEEHPLFYLRAKNVILFATLTEYCPKQWHSIILYSNEVLSCWQAVYCSLSSNCRQSLLPHVFMIDLWVRSQDAWLCHRGTLSWILYILPVHKEWNHDLAYFGFWGAGSSKNSDILPNCPLKTTDSATQECNTRKDQLRQWLHSGAVWFTKSGLAGRGRDGGRAGGNSAQKNKHLIVS